MQASHSDPFSGQRYSASSSSESLKEDSLHRLPSAETLKLLIQSTCKSGISSSTFFRPSILGNTITYAKTTDLWVKTEWDQERIDEWKHLAGLDGIAVLPEGNMVDLPNVLEMIWQCVHSETRVRIYVKFM